MRRRFLSAVLAAVLVVGLLPMTALAEEGEHAIVYSDVNEGDWYYEAVMAMTDGGLLVGKGNGIFDPNGYMTVGEICALTQRIVIRQTEHVFVPGEKATGYVLTEYGTLRRTTFTYNEPSSWAHNYIMSFRRVFTNKPYTPEQYAENVYRGEVIDIMYNIARRMPKYTHYKNGLYVLNDAENMGAFVERGCDGQIADWSKIDGVGHYDGTPGEEVTIGCGTVACNCDMYAVHTHSWTPYVIGDAYYMGLVHGVDSNGTMNCHSYITRAEVCQMLYNMGITKADSVM